MNKIKWIIFCVFTIGGFIALVIYSQTTKTSYTKSLDPSIIQVASDNNGNIADHVYGNTKSKVILINYGDFQCSACGSVHPQIKAIVEEYKDKIQFVFRNFPLTTMHTHAKAAAGAVEAAGLQSKYWEMYNKIYETQADWSELSVSERDTKFADYAKEIGLNVEQYNKDLSSDRISKKISYDVEIGTKLNLAGTPTFYINDKLLDSKVWSDETKLKAALDEAIKNNQ